MPTMRVKDDLNAKLEGTWAVQMLQAPCQSPLWCCSGFFCPCAAAALQRHRILDITGEPYVCCGGSCLCCTQACSTREPWLCMEACCCTSPAILANRFMIQTRFNVQNDPCDNQMLACVACLNVAADCAACFMDKDSAENIQHLEHLINACVCSCMIAQHSAELDRVQELYKGRAFEGPPDAVFQSLPPCQQQMIQQSAFRTTPGLNAPLL
mmetsp:Transcript_10374/g.20873  ORF Transcript_10374/g.20873 Transcript_10374/m.20873 type:complete len:211 (-) Transcript_10374:295-927(-)